MSQLMVEKRAGNRGARQQSLSRRTAKAVFALKRSGYPCSFLVPFASKTRITFSRDVVEKHSPYLNGIAHKGGHYISRRQALPPVRFCNNLMNGVRWRSSWRDRAS